MKLRILVSIGAVAVGIGAGASRAAAQETPHPPAVNIGYLGSRMNLLDVAYGLACHAYPSSSDYGPGGIACDNSLIETAVHIQVTDAIQVGVDYQHVWFVRSVNGVQKLFIVIDGTPHEFTDLPPGQVRSLFFSARERRMVHFNGVDMLVDQPQVLMDMSSQTDRHNYWSYDLDAEQWAAYYGQGVDADPEVTLWAGTWWDETRGRPVPFHFEKHTDGKGYIWRTHATESYAIIMPAPLASPGKNDYGDYLVSGLSYVQGNGPGAVIRPWDNLQQAWFGILDGKQPDGDGSWWPFWPLLQSNTGGESSILKWFGGSRGFSEENSKYFGEKKVNIIGFYDVDVGRGHIMAMDVPEGLDFIWPPWQVSSLQMGYWEDGSDSAPTSARLLAPSGEDLTASKANDPKVVVDDSYGGPVYDVGLGWHEIPSKALNTRELPNFVGDLVQFDVFVPAGAAAWVGSIDMSAEIRSAAVWNTYLGYVDLGSVPRGQWSTVSLTVPPSVLAAFRGDFPRSELRTFANTGISGIRIRGLRTGGTLPTMQRTILPFLNNSIRTNGLLSFENPSDWAGSSLEFQSLRTVNGDKAITVHGDGWREFESRTFTSDEVRSIVGHTLAIDVLPPESMPNPYWVGDLQVYLSCPSVGLWGQYVGRSDFTNMFVGEWNTATFDLPSNILQALVGNATDCQFRIAVNTASGSGAFNFDQLGFLN